MKASMIFYASWKEAIKDMPDNVRLEVYEAVIDYAMTGVTPDLSSLASLAFSFIRQDIDRNTDKYEKLSEIRRNAGRLGGAPKGNQNARKTTKTTKNNQNNTNDNDNDKNISPSISPSQREEECGLSSEERETFLSIFFFKGFINPEAEVDGFINHYEARGWLPNNASRPVVTLKGRAALAKNWTPKTGDGRFPKCAACVSWIRAGYEKAVEKFGLEKAGEILRDIAEIRVVYNKTTEFDVVTTYEVCKMFRSIDNPLVPGLVDKVNWMKSYKQRKLEESQQ